MSSSLDSKVLENRAPENRVLGLALMVTATAQLMLVLDESIANIALPAIQNELGVSPGTLPWVINAYILAFGGLLLFGGRMGDLFGRRHMLQVGMMRFTVALPPSRRPSAAASRPLPSVNQSWTSPRFLAS